jgi:hypothetical protein
LTLRGLPEAAIASKMLAFCSLAVKPLKELALARWAGLHEINVKLFIVRRVPVCNTE